MISMAPRRGPRGSMHENVTVRSKTGLTDQPHPSRHGGPPQKASFRPQLHRPHEFPRPAEQAMPVQQPRRTWQPRTSTMDRRLHLRQRLTVAVVAARPTEGACMTHKTSCKQSSNGTPTLDCTVMSSDTHIRPPPPPPSTMQLNGRHRKLATNQLPTLVGSRAT